MAKILISVTDEKLKKIDELAKAGGKSRSAFMVESALSANAGSQYARPIDDPKIQEALRVMEEARKLSRPGPDAATMIRQLRDGARY